MAVIGTLVKSLIPLVVDSIVGCFTGRKRDRVKNMVKVGVVLFAIGGGSYAAAKWDVDPNTTISITKEIVQDVNTEQNKDINNTSK